MAKDLQKILDEAWKLKKQGKLKESLELYMQAHNILVDESAEYARSIKGTLVDEGGTRKIMPAYFNEADKYLRRDNVFCTILNNIGVIYAEAGDNESARNCFESSIKFTPEGLDYPNPVIGLKEIQA